MKQSILKELETIKSKNGIDILFVVESGSRVWRMDSKNSDYDVRFVYKRSAKDYLRIGKLPDVIEHKKDNMDFVGFDIYKFVKLLLTSNPSMIEWLKSDIIYFDDGKTKELFKVFIHQRFNPIALYHHYLSMCKSNYLKYLKTSENMTHKKYLYCMRGLVNAIYVEHCNNIPPISFINTIKGLSILIPDDVRDKLFEIIELKKDGTEEVKVSKIHLFEDYIEDFLKEEHNIPNRKIIDYSELQEYIYKLLGVN